MNKSDYFPLISTPPIYVDKDHMSFLHSEGELEITEEVDIVWKILAQCNGYQNIDSIVKSISQVSEELIIAIIVDLEKLGVITDSRAQYKHFHRFTENPSVFARDLSFESIRDNVARVEKSIHKDGANSGQMPKEATRLFRLTSNRRSCRSFDRDKGVAQKELTSIARAGYSVIEHVVPSAGGLYPLTLFILVLNPDSSLTPGLYRANRAGELVKLNIEMQIEDLKFSFDSDSLLFGAAAILLIAADLDTHAYKYSNRGYRYTIIEAGHVAQNILLMAEQLGLASLEYGGFLDKALANALQLEKRLHPLVSVAIGKASESEEVNPYFVLEDLTESLVGHNGPVNRVFMTLAGEQEYGENFVAAVAHFKPAKGQNARKSYKDRYSMGTARSANVAKIKAIAEGFERYCSGDVHVDIVGTADDLTCSWIDPREFVPLSAEQLTYLERIQEFNARTLLEWVRGRNIKTGQESLVPIDLVYYPLNSHLLGRDLIYEANSSGVAAYVDEEGAIERALLELVERDAVIKNWLSRQPPGQVHPGHLTSNVRKRIKYWSDEEREVCILDHSHSNIAIVNVCIYSPTHYPCFVNGASASISSMEDAIDKAFQEAELGLIMELSSGGRRKRITKRDIFSPSDHAVFYYYPENFHYLEWLFDGEQLEYSDNMTTLADLIDIYEPIMVKLSQASQPLDVVRVLSKYLIPINFGFRNEHYTHPAAPCTLGFDDLSTPHYFA